MKKMTYLSLGSNIGDAKKNIDLATSLIAEKLGKIEEISSYYETAAWGNPNQADFLNIVLSVKTDLNPDAILFETQQIESVMGREPADKWSPRIIDIDILFIENELVNKKNLVIPHPLLHERNFVLLPMMELSPEFLHPVLNQTIEDIYMECKDECDVIMLEKEN